LPSTVFVPMLGNCPSWLSPLAVARAPRFTPPVFVQVTASEPFVVQSPDRSPLVMVSEPENLVRPPLVGEPVVVTEPGSALPLPPELPSPQPTTARAMISVDNAVRARPRMRFTSTPLHRSFGRTSVVGRDSATGGVSVRRESHWVRMTNLRESSRQTDLCMTSVGCLSNSLEHFRQLAELVQDQLKRLRHSDQQLREAIAAGRLAL